ncbi:MAG: hypothetical protein JST01_14320 [Cyanobacteria bacterium SZAS TMP-1]|nr:hypothetical protein [Cyanobacteria bacterium SZAS TMP-1]
MEISSAKPAPKNLPGREVLARFCSAAWWRHVWQFSWYFKKHLYKPAIIFLISGLIIVPTLAFLQSLNLGDSNVTHDAGTILMQMFSAMAGFAVSGILLIVGMGVGVYRLAAFTRAFLLFDLPPSSESIKTADYKERAEKSYQEAFAVLGHHKGFLAQSWLAAALIMIPVIILFCAANCAWGFALMASAGQQKLSLPPELLPCAIGAAAVSFMILSNYSVAVLAMSSMVNCTTGHIIGRSWLLLITTAPMLTLVTALVLALNTAISTPYAIPQILSASGIDANQPLPLALFWEIWQVATGIMLFPISTAMLIEVVRDCISTEQTLPQPVAAAQVHSEEKTEADANEENGTQLNG